MYKKITHNIIEEHYDHPTMAAAAIQCGNTMTQGQRIMAGTFTNIEYNPSAVALRMMSKDYFSNYLTYLRNYIVNKISGDAAATADAKKLIDQHQTKLMPLVNPFFAVADSQKIGTEFSNLTNRLVAVIDSLVENKDVAMAQTELRNQINTLSDTMYKLASIQWPRQSMVDLLTAFTGAIADQTQARMGKNWSLDSESLRRASDYLISGNTPDLGLSEVLARGIISLRPNRFDNPIFG
jgi:hypothetical protein